jgi:hypothetical protein
MSPTQLYLAAWRAIFNHLFPFILTHTQEASVRISDLTSILLPRSSSHHKPRCTPSLGPLRFTFVPLRAVVHHLGPPPPFPPLRRPMAHLGDWIHDVENVSSMVTHRVITHTRLRRPINAGQSTSPLPTPMVPTGLVRSLRLKTGFHERTCPYDRSSAFDVTCCCFEQRAPQATPTSREEGLSREQPKEKNIKRDSEI